MLGRGGFGMSEQLEVATTDRGRITVRELKRGQRGLFSLAGVAGLLTGGVAVFESGNQAGTVALLAVGSVASLLAVVGKVPLRWVIGGHEFDMSEDAAQEAADVVTSQLKPAETAELAGRLVQLDSGRRNAMTNAILDHVSFEQAAIGRVMQAIAPKGWAYGSNIPVDDRGIDGVILGPNGVSVPVEYKFVRSKSGLLNTIKRARDLQGRVTYGDLVVIVGGTPVNYPEMTTRLAELDSPRIHLVEVDDPEFEKTLVEAIEDSLRT